jgi:Rod binding domain-containing protein
MTVGAISEQTPSGAAPSEQAKIRDAAKQFEALLLAQILRYARQTSSTSGQDGSGECAMDYAEQQFAAVMAAQGGLGLTDLIVSGLSSGEAASHEKAASPDSTTQPASVARTDS